MRLTLRSDTFAVRAALQKIRDTLIELDLGADDLARVEIALAEILNNVVEHACAGCPDGRIDIELIRGTAALQVEVIDNGRAMPDGILPGAERTGLPRNLDQMPEGGFGWQLIRDLAHDLCYERRGEQNHLSFSIDLQGITAA